MSTVGSAYVQIVPSAQGISGSISSVLGGEAESAGASAGASIVSKIKGAIVASGIAAALVKTVQEGARYEQAVGGIETMFGAYSDQMVQYANQAFKTAGLSANEYMEQVTSFSAALLQSTGGDTKKAGEAANQAITDMSDNANKFGTDIASIQNAYQGFAKQNYTMLDNLKLGYGGTKEEMERLLKDAQKISGQKYDISNLNDVYEAIHVVQEEMGVAGTTSKEAASTLSGSFAMMKSSASNFLAQLTNGGDVEGALNDMIDSATTFVIDNLLPALGRIVKALPGIAIRLVGTVLPNMINKLTNKLSKLLDGKAPGTAARFIGKLLVNMAKATGRLVLALVKMFITLGPKLLKAAPGIIKNFVKGLWDAAVGGVKKLIDKIKGLFKFNISLPKIKLPHFTIKPAGWKFKDLLKGKIPHLGIDWYRKAEDDPYMFKGATLFGAGEHNDEVLYGRSALMRDIATVVNKANSDSNNVVVNLNYDASEDSRDMLRDLARGIRRYKMAGVM